MAVDDIVFSEGDYQNFILEIPNEADGVLIEVTFSASINDFLIEIPTGVLNAPIDWLTDPFSCHGILFNNLTLVGGSGGSAYFAY
jgi:hypothetical protein